MASMNYSTSFRREEVESGSINVRIKAGPDAPGGRSFLPLAGGHAAVDRSCGVSPQAARGAGYTFFGFRRLREEVFQAL